MVLDGAIKQVGGGQAKPSHALGRYCTSGAGLGRSLPRAARVQINGGQVGFAWFTARPRLAKRTATRWRLHYHDICGRRTDVHGRAVAEDDVQGRGDDVPHAVHLAAWGRPVTHHRDHKRPPRHADRRRVGRGGESEKDARQESGKAAERRRAQKRRKAGKWGNGRAGER